MTWDPTDRQGWKRAFETSTSSSVPPRPTKKVRFDVTSDTGDVQLINGRVGLGTNINTENAEPAKNSAAVCELPNIEPGLMRSFFRRKAQHPRPPFVPEPTQTEVILTESSGYPPALHTQGNNKLYNVLHPSYSESNISFNEATTSLNASASPCRPLFDQYINGSSSNDLEDVTAMLTRPVSSSFARTDFLTPVPSTLLITEAESTPISNGFTKPQLFSSQASTPSHEHQRFLFGNGGDDLDGGYKSDYFDKIKSNPYTAALLPCAPKPGIPIPQNATEARYLFKKGRYGQARRDTVSHSTVEELQRVLQDLRKRFAKLKVMCDTAGIDATGDIWYRTIAIVEGDRPDIKEALDQDTGNGLAEYTKQVERWDKAVGHQAILMKRLNYKQQIAALEKKIKDVKAAAAEDTRDSEWRENESEAGREGDSEWKGHKTRLGRRFSGLIEKD